MRCSVAAFFEGSLLLLGALACQSKPEPPPPAPSASPRPALSERVTVARPARAEAVVAVEKAVQASKLRPPARRGHLPRLAFGKGVFARLGELGVEVYEEDSFRLLDSVPLEAPRALVTLADGALLALGGRGLLRWELGRKNRALLPKPVLLPGSELHADAREPDRFWIFEPLGAPPTLRSFRLPTEAPGLALLLAEQTIELAAGGSSAAFGVTREGVWLHLTPGHAQRFAPGGAKLAPLTLGADTLPTWVLPARRLDHSTWVDEMGTVRQTRVSPTYQRLATAQLSGTAYMADVGDEGRLLAVVEVTGQGPRFELELFDSQLERLARVPLPGDAPTGDEDWIKVVTRNQEIAVASRRPRVAVGGPGRFRIFDGAGSVVFSMPSM